MNEQRKSMKELPRTVEITLQGNTYTVSFPKVGQLIDIEVKKSMFSGRQYSTMATANLKNSNIALDLIDSIAYFTTLIPDLLKDLKVDNLFDLDLLSSKELTKQYKKVFLPWFMAWRDAINLEEEETDEKEVDREE